MGRRRWSAAVGHVTHSVARVTAVSLTGVQFINKDRVPIGGWSCHCWQSSLRHLNYVATTNNNKSQQLLMQMDPRDALHHVHCVVHKA